MIVSCRIEVKFWTTSKWQRGGRVFAVGVMLALWLATLVVAACPQIHQLLHHDAQSATHSCLVTQVQQHLLTAGFATAVIPTPPPTGLGLIFFAESQFLPTCDCRLSPSRAPPLILSSTTVVG